MLDQTSDSKWAGVETVNVEAAGIAEKRRGCGGGECKIFYAYNSICRCVDVKLEQDKLEY